MTPNRRSNSTTTTTTSATVTAFESARRAGDCAGRFSVVPVAACTPRRKPPRSPDSVPPPPLPPRRFRLSRERLRPMPPVLALTGLCVWLAGCGGLGKAAADAGVDRPVTDVAVKQDQDGATPDGPAADALPGDVADARTIPDALPPSDAREADAPGSV